MIVVDNPDNAISDSLLEAVLAVHPMDSPDVERRAKKFGIFDYNVDQNLNAGVLVYVHPGWAYIDMLWVTKELRGQGLGRHFMKLAEAESVKRGCHYAYLWTQDFEAPDFYEKLGYKRFVAF
jgi:ribosomal protein S18 acetylase RimI-like enzyme